MQIELNWIDADAIFLIFLVSQNSYGPVSLRRRMRDALITWRWDEEGWKLNFAPPRLCSANRRQRPLKYHLGLVFCRGSVEEGAGISALVCVCMKYWFPMRFPFWLFLLVGWRGVQGSPSTGWPLSNYLLDDGECYLNWRRWRSCSFPPFEVNYNKPDQTHTHTHTAAHRRRV